MGYRPETLRACPETADARQHDAIGRTHDVGICCHRHLQRSRGPERIGHRMQVARAVVDQCEDLGHVPLQPPSCPLVEGIASPLRPSRLTAWRIARAKPLNIASHTWWLLIP